MGGEFPIDEEDLRLLKDLNQQLRALLDDAHPGLVTWRQAVYRVISMMADNREGLGCVYKFVRV